MKPHNKPEVYVGGIGHRGSHGIESTEKNYMPLDWIGAVNVAKRVESSIGSHVFMDKETLLYLDPDIIFIDGGGLETGKGGLSQEPGILPCIESLFDAAGVHLIAKLEY
jgi:iron complex transport system substrate-binding protein